MKDQLFNAAAPIVILMILLLALSCSSGPINREGNPNTGLQEVPEWDNKFLNKVSFPEEITKSQKASMTHWNIYEFTYDDCEYIMVSRTRQSGISHKGNCKNPVHYEKN